MKRSQRIPLIIVAAAVGGCAQPQFQSASVPAREYADRIRAQYADQSVGYTGQTRRPGNLQTVSSVIAAEGRDQGRARLRFAADGQPLDGEQALAIGEAAALGTEPEFTMKRSTMEHTRDYVSPLMLGNPGVTASLWQESRSNSDLFRDVRAWQPMDLITIVVSENAESKMDANTEVKQSSTVEAAIESLLGIETDIAALGNRVSTGTADPASLINATTQNDFKGEGKTNRKGSLRGKISAMVAEVLPSGVLRIEGEKIVSVNNEQQIMVISGLVRPRDVSAENEVDSSKIAQLRVDYYGKGTVGEAQSGGWLGRALRKIWPF